MNATEAIARSINHNEIVFLEYARTTADELMRRSDDWIVSGTTIEYWGTHEGDEWRVHLQAGARV